MVFQMFSYEIKCNLHTHPETPKDPIQSVRQVIWKKSHCYISNIKEKEKKDIKICSQKENKEILKYEYYDEMK